MGIKERVADFLCIGVAEVERIVAAAPRNYKLYRIHKRSGGERSIYHPAKETKAIQYALMQIALRHLPVHRAATAYIHGLSSPLRLNASAHAPFRYSVKLDFADFFPSVTPEDLYRAVEDYYGNGCLTTNDKSFLRNSLFIIHHSRWILPIGAPSSPMVSNAIMYPLDNRLSSEAAATAVPSSYTRYADDTVFSCNEKGGCNRFTSSMESLLRTSTSPLLRLNQKKTFYLSNKGRRVIVGLYITPDAKISIGRPRKRKIRSLINSFQYNKITKVEFKWLKGILSFVRDVEPSFYNRLVIKYGSSTFDLLGNTPVQKDSP